MQYLPMILTVAGVHFLALLSPGPDFILVTRNSLLYSRKTGIFSAIGLGLGIIVHITYSLIGIGLIISKSILLFSLMKYLGAGYLFYIGYKSLRAKQSNISSVESKSEKHLDKMTAIRMGFLTNATNPKATLFFLSLFTLVIQPSTPFGVKLFMGIEMSVVTALYFTLLAVIFSHGFFRMRVSKIQLYAERFMGAILIALGVKLILSGDK